MRYKKRIGFIGATVLLGASYFLLPGTPKAMYQNFRSSETILRPVAAQSELQNGIPVCHMEPHQSLNHPAYLRLADLLEITPPHQEWFYLRLNRNKEMNDEVWSELESQIWLINRKDLQAIQEGCDDLCKLMNTAVADICFDFCNRIFDKNDTIKVVVSKAINAHKDQDIIYWEPGGARVWRNIVRFSKGALEKLTVEQINGVSGHEHGHHAQRRDRNIIEEISEEHRELEHDADAAVPKKASAYTDGLIQSLVIMKQDDIERGVEPRPWSPERIFNLCEEVKARHKSHPTKRSRVTELEKLKQEMNQTAKPSR